VQLFRQEGRITYRERIALRVASIFLIIYVAIIALLTLMPHAILLSSTGSLFPSAFSRSLVAIVAFGVILFSVSFAWMAGHVRTLSGILQFLSYGIAKGAPLVIVLFLLIQLYVKGILQIAQKGHETQGIKAEVLAETHIFSNLRCILVAVFCHNLQKFLLLIHAETSIFY
jgi:p-aminobenzoyl-glutamate transporter AbgT